MIVDDIYKNNFKRETVTENLRARDVLSMKEALKQSKIHPGIIAEYKRKSPSGFRNETNTDIFKYFNGIKSNIAGISILTEPQYFDGNPLDAVSVQCYSKPILIKDFISNEKMVESSYKIGGDAFLLICDFLNYDEIKRLVKHGAMLGLEALVELHDPEKIKNIYAGENVIIGYNRRDLRTLKMDDRSETVYDKLHSFGLPVILESGISSINIKTLHIEKYDGLLIGGSLLSGDEIKLR
ncbi:MAG: indole-3-glycerol-phosphate synthase TrpC [Ferroplasma sp.]